jgi:sec-independent protein translocase protein TatB
MFEVGFTEIILILGIALLVLGPEKLPKLANQVGRWAGRARAMARQLRQQLDEEVTVIDADDFGPKARRAPGTAAVGTPPPAPPAPPTPTPTPAPTAEKPETTPPPS